MNFRLPKIAFPLAVLLCINTAISCKQMDVYEKNTPIPHYKWQDQFRINGTFTITDTVPVYNIYMILRHTDAYQYNNIWLNIGLQAPGDTMYFQKLNLVLASDATCWEGSGMNDIWEVRKIISTRRFSKKGEYVFRIGHIMRDNPLPGIISAGIRVQKAE